MFIKIPSFSQFFVMLSVHGVCTLTLCVSFVVSCFPGFFLANFFFCYYHWSSAFVPGVLHSGTFPDYHTAEPRQVRVDGPIIYSSNNSFSTLTKNSFSTKQTKKLINSDSLFISDLGRASEITILLNSAWKEKKKLFLSLILALLAKIWAEGLNTLMIS